MLVNTNSAEVALDSSALTSAILLETSADKLLVNTNSADSALDCSASTSAILLETSADKLLVNTNSAEVALDSSEETLVVNDVSAEFLVDSSVDTLVVNDASPEILDDSSVDNSFPNSFKAAVTLLAAGEKVELPVNAMFVAIIPVGLLIVALFNNKSDCKSKTILVVAIKKNYFLYFKCSFTP